MASPSEATERAKELAQLTRNYESTCNVKYPTEHDIAFRTALQKKIAEHYKLSELKDKVIVNPEARPARR
jgi:hypothetical protein